MKNRFIAAALAAVCFASAATAGVMPATVIAADSDTTPNGRTMTLNDVVKLSQKGKSITWTDFDEYGLKYRNTGAYSRFCKVDLGNDFFLIIGGEPNFLPQVIWLCYKDTETYVDVKTDDVKAFISEYQKETPQDSQLKETAEAISAYMLSNSIAGDAYVVKIDGVDKIVITYDGHLEKIKEYVAKTGIDENLVVYEQGHDMIVTKPATTTAAKTTTTTAKTTTTVTTTTTDSTIKDLGVFEDGETMTLDDVVELSKKGNALTLNDFVKYKGVIAGSGIFILEYDLGNGYTLMVGSMTLEKVDYARLRFSGSESFIDIRTDDVEAFLNGTSGDTIESTKTVTVTVTEVNGDNLIVKPEEGSQAYKVSNKFAIPTKYIDSGVAPAPGMMLEVTYTKDFLTTYPAKFSEIKKVTVLKTFTVLETYDTHVLVSVDGSRLLRDLMFLYKKYIDSNIDPVLGMKLTLGYSGILETFPGQFTGVHDVKVVSENAGLIKGDSNCDGSVDMADVVFIMQALANPDRYGEKSLDYTGITALGKLNADMNGDGLTVGDALTIQRKLLGLENENSFDASGIITFEMEPTKTGVEEFLANDPKIANDHEDDELYNVTPAEITEKFGFTVFKFAKSCESYVVYKDKTYLLESSFGGPGTISFAVADLNKDGNYELYFTFSYGSGMNHAEVSCFDTSEDTEFYFCSDYFNDDMTLTVENGKLCVYKAAYKDLGSVVHIKTEPKEKIGEIVYEYGVIRFKRTDIAESDETKVKINTIIPEYGSEYVEMKADEAMVSSYDQASSSLNGMGVWFKFESPKYPVTVSTENGKFRIFNYKGGGLGSVDEVGKSYTVGRSGEVCFAPENGKLSDDYKAEVKVTGEENGKTVDLGTLVITKTDKNTKGVLSVTFKKAGSASLAGKKFYYEKEGFGGYCNIEFNEDGTFLYSPGVLSSYLGGGTWEISGNKVILTQENDGMAGKRVNCFRIVGNELIFIEADSDNFVGTKVKDGEKFSITAADTSDLEKTRLFL